MPFVKLPGVDLYCRVRGRGEALLLIHGFGSSSLAWRSQLETLSRHFRVIAPDLRGHGRTRTAPRAPITIEQMARDLVLLLDALQVEQAHIVGASLGGCVAQRLGVDFPERVRSLVLVNTFSRFASSRLPKPVVHGVGGALLALATRLARWLPLRRCRFGLRALAREFGRTPGRAKRATLRTVAHFNITPELRAIRCPTLVLAGRRDRWIPRKATQLLHRSIPSAQLAYLSGGHRLCPRNAHELNALLLSFLSVLSAGWLRP